MRDWRGVVGLIMILGITIRLGVAAEAATKKAAKKPPSIDEQLRNNPVVIPDQGFGAAWERKQLSPEPSLVDGQKVGEKGQQVGGQPVQQTGNGWFAGKITQIVRDFTWQKFMAVLPSLIGLAALAVGIFVCFIFGRRAYQSYLDGTELGLVIAIILWGIGFGLVIAFLIIGGLNLRGYGSYLRIGLPIIVAIWAVRQRDWLIFGLAVFFVLLVLGLPNWLAWPALAVLGYLVVSQWLLPRLRRTP